MNKLFVLIVLCFAVLSAHAETVSANPFSASTVKAVIDSVRENADKAYPFYQEEKSAEVFNKVVGEIQELYNKFRTMPDRENLSAEQKAFIAASFKELDEILQVTQEEFEMVIKTVTAEKARLSIPTTDVAYGIKLDDWRKLTLSQATRHLDYLEGLQKQMSRLNSRLQEVQKTLR